MRDKKHRDAGNLFAVEGGKLVNEAKMSGINIKQVFFTDSVAVKHGRLISDMHEAGVQVYNVTDDVYEKISSEKNPEGIFAVCEKFSTFGSCDKEKVRGPFVMLENIQDPSNLGTIIRTACALGTENILLTDDCADIYNYKTQRAAMGTLYKVKIFVTKNIVADIEYQKTAGNRVFAAALCSDSADISDIEFLPGDSIVIGNEGSGIKSETLLSCTGNVIIPMKRNAESLNAAAAAAIFIWERQKGMIK